MHALGTVVTGWCSAFRGPGGSSQLAADAAPIMMRDRHGVLGGQQPSSGCHSYLRAVFRKRVDSRNGRAGLTGDFR